MPAIDVFIRLHGAPSTGLGPNFSYQIARGVNEGLTDDDLAEVRPLAHKPLSSEEALIALTRLMDLHAATLTLDADRRTITIKTRPGESTVHDYAYIAADCLKYIGTGYALARDDAGRITRAYGSGRERMVELKPQIILWATDEDTISAVMTLPPTGIIERYNAAIHDPAHPTSRLIAQPAPPTSAQPTSHEETVDPKLLEPAVHAQMYSDDHLYSWYGDVTAYLAQCSDDELHELIAIEWGKDYPADAIAQWYADQEKAIERMLDYCQQSGRVGFEVQVDQDEAHQWLRQHRRHLVDGMKMMR